MNEITREEWDTVIHKSRANARQYRAKGDTSAAEAETRFAEWCETQRPKSRFERAISELSAVIAAPDE